MPLEIKCESCGKRYRVDEKFAGKRVKCRNCGASIAVVAEGDDEQDLSALSAASMAGESMGESVSSFVGAPAQFDRSPAREDEGDEQGDEAPLPGGFGAAIRAARSRSDSRRFRLLAYPGAKVVDQALPWLIGAACLIPIIWQGIAHAMASAPAWITFTHFGLIFLLFLVLIVPATTRGIRMAGEMLHFQLPDSAGWRTLGVFSLPFALAALFYWQIEGMSGLIFGLAVGILLVGPLLLVVLQLHWVEAVVAWMMGAQVRNSDGG